MTTWLPTQLGVKPRSIFTSSFGISWPSLHVQQPKWQARPLPSCSAPPGSLSCLWALQWGQLVIFLEGRPISFSTSPPAHLPDKDLPRGPHAAQSLSQPSPPFLLCPCVPGGAPFWQEATCSLGPPSRWGYFSLSNLDAGCGSGGFGRLFHRPQGEALPLGGLGKPNGAEKMVL